ncbi:caspase fold protease [Cryptosporidium ubiquitum]|uniref:separase n=1 Tax=Cryptosporidium ubiquitum TaxID=857276 RepID=A0A1J4ML19_9CRYT|nr:caspase fold protease [Cryptosporidium ubiquitum]OII74147.1 caspase fold protease [Cryptosporidium ubiquitum]
MDNNLYEVLFELSKDNKFEDLLIQCLELLLIRINAIFSFENKHANNTSKLQDETNLPHIFESLTSTFEDSTRMEIIIAIKKNLMKMTNFCEIEKLFQTNINQVLDYFEEIYKIYEFITVCCIELKNTKKLMYYLVLSHNILPCFIIGDLLFLRKNMAGNWNTEKILISSIAKVSKEIYRDQNSKFLSTKMEELYFSWIICLDNLLEYLKTRLFIINNSRNNFSKEILGLTKYTQELFYWISRSNLSYYYQILIIIIFCDSLSIKTLNNNQMLDLFEDPSLNNVNMLSGANEVDGIHENIIKILNKFLKFRMHNEILDLLVILNGLSTLLINIVHQNMKKLNSPETDLHIRISHNLYINSMEYYCFNVKFEAKELKIMELHYLKARLCMANQLLLERLYLNQCLTNKFNQIALDRRYQKVLTSYLFLTIGVINSFSKIELDKNLIFIIGNLLDSQCFILENILSENLSFDSVFFKNMDSYRTSLLNYIIKQIFFLRSKNQKFEFLCDNCIFKIVKIFSLFLEIQTKQIQEHEENVGTIDKIKIKFKTSICEVVIRFIQYRNGILDELFNNMEEMVNHILNNTQIKDNSDMDEIILNFLLSISENLIRLSSQMRSIKNYKDSVKLLNLALKCLSNTFTVPWVAVDESIYEIEKKIQKLKIVEERPNINLSRYLYLTPIRKYDYLQEENNLTIDNLLNFTEKNHFEELWKNENFEFYNYESIKHKNVGFVSYNTNVKFENLLTPFTQKLRSKGLSQIQSQTIKRIQTSAISYIVKSKSQFNKINGREIIPVSKKLKDGEIDFPIHILLFLIALDQIISSIQLQFSQEPTKTFLENILLLVEEKLSILFTLIDHCSYLFIFGDRLIELFPFIEDFDKIYSSKIVIHEKNTNCNDQIVKQYFFNLFSSIVARFTKAKLLLINEFSTNKMTLYRYPAVKNERNYVIQIIWFNLELNYYLYYREVSSKYNQIFKKGILNGFCAEIINVYKIINKFIDERRAEKLVTSSKLNFELYFKFKVEFLNYYLWLMKVFNIQNNNLVDSKVIYKSEINIILDELTSLINKISLDYKLLYLSRMNTYNIYLLFFEDFNNTFSTITSSNLSKDKNNKIHINIQESLNLLYKYLGIHENYEQNFCKLITLEYWEDKLNSENNTILCSKQNIAYFQQNVEKEIFNEFEDIPIPINNKINGSEQEDKKDKSFGFESNNYSKSSLNINSFMLKTNELINNQEFYKVICEIGLNELEILLYNTYEVLEIILSQGLDSKLSKKLIGAALYFFNPCWTFILSFKSNLIDIETVSKYIHYSLSEFIENFQLFSMNNTEQKEMIIMNIGLFVSNILYYSARLIDRELYDSNDSIIKWLGVANIYLDGLLFLVENKYLLSSDFIDEKISIPSSVKETLLNLIVLKIESINIIDEVFSFLEIINRVGVDEIINDKPSNMALFIRILNKLSTLFMKANKPDISLFYLLESNKITQVIILWLETCNINSLHWQHNILSTCLSHNFQIYFINLVLKSLTQLGEFWWKLGVIERSQSVYNKIVAFYKKWTIPYKKLIVLYFYQLPTLLNHIFSRSDSQFNLVYSIDNLDLFKKTFYEKDISGNSEGLNIDFLKEILEYIKIISVCKYLSYFEEEIILMKLLFILLYFTLNNSLPIIKDYFINNFPFIFQNDTLLPENCEFKIIQTLRKIIIKLLKDNINSSNLILELLSINADEYLKNKYFMFFLSNTVNYILLFISSKYTEIIGTYFIKKCSKEAIQNIVILENEFDIIKKFNSNIKKNSIEFTIKEICKLIISIKQILSIELTPVESQVILIEPTKLNNSNYENKLISSNYSIEKNELNSIVDQISQEESIIKNRLHLFKQILVFVDTIFKHMLLNERMNYYLLNQLSASIILDITLLIKVLCYPDTSWNTIFCCFINSLTPISLSNDYSFSIIQSIRTIQREFEHFRIKDKYNSVFESNIQPNLLKFFLDNKNNELSNWRWGGDISIKEIEDNISMVYIRFSTFFTNFTYKSSNNFKYSLLQITKDFSYNGYISELTNAINNQSRYNSSKLTLFYFVENARLNKLLEEFDNIQRMNTESIINIDIDTNSSEQARQWWNKRISIESRLNKWLINFSNQILNGWITKLFYGWNKKLSIKKNFKQVMEFVKTHLIDINQSLINIILFSLTNNAPQILALLESNNMLNLDLTEIRNQFKKIKFQSSRNKVEKLPVIVFLDKILICLPIESIYDLRYQPITRGINRRICKNNMDNFFQQLRKHKENNLHLLADFCNLYYCINPTGDLEETEKIITAFIKQKFGSKCSGISNSTPQATVIMNNMCINQSNLYLFCGHQAGERFIQGEAFERGVVTGNLNNGKNHFYIPPSLLIGCSSSKIRSYGSNNIFFTPMHYLIGGSPFVLGALWDVTDQDIDRFTMSIFDNWVGLKLSLIESITLARQECKLPLLNGSSCVCFGYPI